MKKVKQKEIRGWVVIDSEGKLVEKLPNSIPLGLSVFLIAPKRNKYLTIAKFNERNSGRNWDRNKPKIIPCLITLLPKSGKPKDKLNL